MRPLILCALLLPSIALAQFDCKPSSLPNGEAQSGDTFMRVSTVGAFAAWRCKSNGVLQMAVVRHDYVTAALSAEWDTFRKDPSHQRMNQMLAAHKTGDWHTDPKLVEVWGPWATQLQAIK
jgi:hypothetical protein